MAKLFFLQNIRRFEMSQITKEDALKIASQVMHPAVDRNLVDLGIVKNIEIKEENATVIFAFPFPNIPIADQLVSSVRGPLEKRGLNVDVQITVMSPAELQAFLAMEQEAWKGM